MLKFYLGNNFSTVQDFKHEKHTDEENTAGICTSSHN